MTRDEGHEELQSRTCLNILVLSQSNGKDLESDSKSSTLGEDGEKSDFQDKVAVDPGGLPGDKKEDPLVVQHQSLVTLYQQNEWNFVETELLSTLKSCLKIPKVCCQEKHETGTNYKLNDIKVFLTFLHWRTNVACQSGKSLIFESLSLINIFVFNPAINNKSQLEQEISLKDTKSAEEVKPENVENIQTQQSDVDTKDINQSPPLSQPEKEPESDQSKDKKIALESTKDISEDTESTDGQKDSVDNKHINGAPVSDSPQGTIKSKETTENKAALENVQTTETDKEMTSSTEEPKQQYPKQPLKDGLSDEKQNDKDDSDKPGPNSSVNKQTKRKQHNYASKECGAKILANNPEAENVRSILNSNKDDYMINPCKARKWFIIELCEPVQLSKVEIASFELFSSQPKHFYVGFSDRYPTKEWKTYGFDTKDERALQSFTLPEEDVYYKYVKVEITDHYGEEHFCPLTLFKVYGIAVEYDDDYSVPSEDDNDLDQAVLQTGDETSDHQSPKNLFSSAKDTVMKIVKKVLSVGEKKEDINGTDTGNMTDKQINDTLKLNISKEGFILPCVPEIKSRQKVMKSKLNLPEPSATIVRKLEDHEQVPSEEKPEALVTFLGSETDIGSLPQKISNCLEENKMTNTSVEKNKTKNFSNMTTGFCAYVQLMMLNKVILTCASEMIKATKSEMTESSFILIDKTVTKETTFSTSSLLASEDNVQKQTEKITSRSDADHTTTTTVEVAEPTTDTVDKNKMSTDTVYIESSTSTKTNKESLKSKVELSTSTVTMETQTKQEEIISSPSSVFVTVESSVVTTAVDEPSKPAESLPPSSDSSMQDQMTLEPSISSSSCGGQHSSGYDTILSIGLRYNNIPSKIAIKHEDEQKTVSTSQSSTEKATSIEPTPSMDYKPESQFTDPPIQQGHTEQKSTQLPVKEQVEPVQEKKLNDTDEQELNKPDIPKQRDLGLVRIPIMPFQKRDPIMRLNNRIKALELNVSLSSRYCRYNFDSSMFNGLFVVVVFFFVFFSTFPGQLLILFLDRMSQKFKRQSEDLMKTLNKTIGRFENVTREAEIREKKQKEQISVLEAQIENLTSIVVRLTRKMDTIDKEVTDRQMVWTSIEVVILIILFLICLRRGKSTEAQIPPEIKRLLETMPRQPDISLNPRRNSFSAIEDKSAITTVGPAIQKYQSETTLVASTDMLDNTQIKFDPGGHKGANHQYKQMEYGKEVTKKKKKKKKTHDKSHICESNESLTDINSAGLLFSVGGITPDCSNSETVKRSSSHGILSRLFWGSDKSNESSKKVTIGPTTVAAGKPPKIPSHSTSVGNTRSKRHSVDESGGSKIKKNGCVSQSQSYTYGVHEVQKGKYLPNGNSNKLNDSKGHPNSYKGPMLNGKVAKHSQTKHVRGKSADFTPTDHDKSSGLWMNLIGRK
ncbi:hypothetical protein KUTeg_021427 [Tegillarca granosa]|uniref:SUN domain-containing protein n=1 Tax=Tegillarca granosa TaxID=220873 RepID=A0ABQ9E9C4_TEGGR|nr:hypothetical protein KUTeg_021427 [Tegillarca granosa]